MKETPIMHACRAALVETGRVMLWRNSVGADITRGVKYGLGLGSADLVGLLSGASACPHCGGPVRTGRFVGFEIKAPRGVVEPNQILWHSAVRAASGFVAVVRSPDAALEALDRAYDWRSE